MKTHLFLKRLLLVWVFAISGYVWGQTTIESQPFGNQILPSGWIQTSITFENGYAKFLDNASELISPSYNLSGYTNVKLSFSVAQFGSGTSGPLNIEISNDGGISWTAQNFNSGTPTNSTYINTVKQPITVSGTTVKIRFKKPNGTTQKRFKDYVLEGTPIAAAPVITPATVNGNVGTAINYQIVGTNGPTSYTIVSGTLPAGLSLNTTTGIISGTPTTVGTSSVNVTATNGTGTSTPATLDFNISKGNQTITFASLPSKEYGDVNFNVTGTSSSGLAVDYQSSDPLVATISGSTVTIVGVGSTNITASQTGDANYNAAPNVPRTLTVTAKALTITGLTANNKVQDGTTTATLSGTAVLNGVLSADATDVSLTGTPTANFADAIVASGKTVTVAGYTLTGSKASNYTLTQPSLNANITALGAPIATATNINANGFTTNWGTVSGAAGYRFDVYTGSTSPGTTITETFTAIGGSTSSSYDDRSWTGDCSISWTAFKSRTDQEVNIGNEAITLRDQSGAYLLSGVIPSGITNISFDVKQVFSGSGGIVTVKILTGPNYTNETIIGTKAYNTTTSTYNSGIISGITGSYKIRIDNNSSARSAIDNLSFTSAPISTISYVPTYENLNVGNVTSYPITGLNPGTTYFYRVRAVSGTATSANSNVVDVTTSGPITWSGSAWSNNNMGPDATKDAVIAASYTITAPITVKNLTVNAALTVTTSATAETVTNNSSIIVEDNASFIQPFAGTYTGLGTFTVKRLSSSVANKYAFWSSPITSQNMYGIFPTAPAFVMTYNTGTNFYDLVPNTATSTAGVGYSIKTPTGASTATFDGIPNNGVITVPLSKLGDKYNLVGNPYPSNLNLTTLLAVNSGKIGSTLWFWDNTSNAITTQNGSTQTNVGYATFNAAGTGTWVNAPNKPVIPIPTTTFAKVGQAFIVEALGTAPSDLIFNNTMRDATTGINFNKNNSNNATEGKYWLTLSTSYNAKLTQAVTYQSGASNNFDMYDSKALDLGSDAFYSFANAEKVLIQGKGDFDVNDVVILGNKHFESGNFTIELSQKEGVFNNGQAIYLKDKQLGTYTDLQNGTYSFSSTGGEFSNRFEIVYLPQSTLGTQNTIAKDGIKVYKNGDDFIIESPSKISSIEVYEASGKLVRSFKSNANKEIVNGLLRGVYVIKVVTATETISQKVIK